MFRKGKTLKGVLLFNALSAIGGGIGLVTGTLPLPTMLLRHTPFDSFVIPGLFLTIIIGGSALTGAIALRTHARRARLISATSGVIMVGWIAGETILVRGFSVLQGLYLLTGLLVGVLSWYLPVPRHAAEPQPPRRRAKGPAGAPLRIESCRGWWRHDRRRGHRRPQLPGVRHRCVGTGPRPCL